MWVDLGNILEVQSMEIGKKYKERNVSRHEPLKILILINRLMVALILKIADFGKHLF